MKPLLFLLLALAVPAFAEHRIGVAKVDVTPDYPVRLNGFAARKAESDGVAQRVWVKALAFADDANGPAVLITADTLGIPASIRAEVAARLADANVKPERLTITASHTHSAPMLRGVANAIFGHDLSPEEWAHITNYTETFTDALEAVARAAIKDMQPATLETITGTVGFAFNRRTKGGPTDHALPLLVVRSADGRPRAVWFSYACHCVTLGGGKISGDWAGHAMEEIEKDFPGSVALASIGCGADQNPPRSLPDDVVERVAAQGRELADEVKRLLGEKATPLAAGPAAKLVNISLDYAKPRTRAEWIDLAKKGGQLAYYARLNLMRLDRGDGLPAKLDYPIQTWTFGDSLALVFLPGEVVVDYGLRLKRELRDVITIGYANDAPAYIPSERVLREGGYEGEGAMIYYDRPNKFAAGLEQKIVDAVHAQVPQFRPADGGARGTEGRAPLSPGDEARAFKTKPGLAVELVAAEPLVQSPVAIDWGADGRLWVCEMFDYPTGLDGNWKPGGRIKVLADADADGRYDKATVFLDGLPFPTGVTAFGNGAIICAAPDILFAEDTDGDGRADKVEKWFSGFATDNYQARVNSITPGLDGWFYGANGLLGGKVAGVELGKRDFRFRADSKRFEPAGGFTQMSRVRDDWGRWFGCENGASLFHFPLAEHYVVRNPRAAPPGSLRNLTPGGKRVFPIADPLPRYNDPQAAARFTAACGVGIYRDDALGAEYRGNAFTCEPAHNLVTRARLTDGPLPIARRADDEQASEFLANTDIWFRPVQARTGPDGALYIVDMYRFLIEHPRWIPADRLAGIDVRAGAEMGRIWRVVRAGSITKPVRDLTTLDARALLAALDSPNGTERDRVQLQLQRLWPQLPDQSGAGEALASLARAAALPEVRVHALSLLDMLGALQPANVEHALADKDARVREHAVRVSRSGARPEETPGEDARIAKLAGDPDPGVRFQVALTLGDLGGRDAATALETLASGPDAKDPWFRAAIRSSAAKHAVTFPGEATAPPATLDDAAMKQLAAQLTSGATTNRGEVLQRFVPALSLDGDAKHGGEIFAGRCATCHRVGGMGHDVGASLDASRGKPADWWLKNILDPNAVIEPANVGAIIETTTGRTLAGIVKAETATSLTVAAPGGASEVILRAEVKSRARAPLSLMPEGLEAGLSAQDMADLTAFLRK